MECALSLGMLRLAKFYLLFFASFAYGTVYDFDLFQKGVDNNNTLLVIGGIQGDEPGSFHSASLLASHYTIKSGSLWVVPNLNFYSILERNRGPYGDMNRKFATLSQEDPEYQIIQNIKRYIRDDAVKMIVNLHDGSGYYRPSYEDELFAPHRWGQCCIIDQENIMIQQYGDLQSIANSVVEHINGALLHQKDRYHLHNTHTSQGNKEMEKTLTYYAIGQNKAAFGNEASKELPTHERVYYHLLALEKYMQIMGIKFTRSFELSPLGVYKAINEDISLSFYGGKISLPLAQIRDTLNYFPLTIDPFIAYKASSPLVMLQQKAKSYTVQYGNRKLVQLNVEHFEHEALNVPVEIEVDGSLQNIALGSLVQVKEEFLVKRLKDFRINVIGFQTKTKDECEILIKKTDIPAHFSIDKKAKIYRIEYYKEEKFAGMILVKFV